MRRVRRGALRRWMAALALLAASFLLLQPICNAYELQGAMQHMGATHGSAPCCAEPRSDALAGPSASYHEQIQPIAAVACPVAPAAALTASPRKPQRAALQAPPPPPQLSYCSRSARILR